MRLCQLVFSVRQGLQHSYRLDAFEPQHLESLVLRRQAMTQTLLQAFGTHTSGSNLDSQCCTCVRYAALATCNVKGHCVHPSQCLPILAAPLALC